MKKITKIISTALAALTVVSTMSVAAVSVSAATLKKPTSVKAVNGEKSIKVSWKKVKGATKYKVFRGKKAIKTTKATSIKDFSIKSGKAYSYKVKAYKGKKASKASKTVKITRMNYTLIKNVNNGEGQVTLNWTKRTGANQYKLYRKTTGSYSLLKNTTAVSYTDKNVVSGTKYTYKIVCYNTKTKTKSQDCTAKSITYLDKVTGVFAQEATDTKSVAVKWDAVKGAASYTVYRLKAGDAAYTKLATSTSTSYKDTQLSVNPTAYMYKIVAVKGDSASVESDSRIAPYAPKRNGVNTYYRDGKQAVHVVLQLKQGEEYAEGKALVEYASVQGLYTVTPDNSGVVTVENDVIKAVKPGKATITIKMSDTVATLVNAVANAGATKGYNKAVNKTAYVEVEVVA